MSKRHEHKIHKQEVTKLKIELASAALKAESDRRKKQGHDGIHCTFAGVSQRVAYGQHGNQVFKGRVTQSNKYLIGKLGSLCELLRENGIAYPWRDEVTA